MAIDIRTILNEFQSIDPLKLTTRAVGTFTKKAEIRGNSILSSVFIKSISAGATLKVNYFDTSSGDEDLGERFDLDGHTLITDAITAPFTDRVTVTRIHNKPVMEAIVTGGTIEFGVYFTVVSSFASDLDAALVFDGQTHVPADDKGIPVVCLNTGTGLLEFIECDSDGVLVNPGGVSTPANASIAFAVADTEQSYAFPASTKHFCISNESNAVIKASWTALSSGTNYFELIPGQVYNSPPSVITAASTTIYWQSNKVLTSADGLKVISWS